MLTLAWLTSHSVQLLESLPVSWSLARRSAGEFALPGGPSVPVVSGDSGPRCPFPWRSVFLERDGLALPR